MATPDSIVNEPYTDIFLNSFKFPPLGSLNYISLSKRVVPLICNLLVGVIVPIPVSPFDKIVIAEFGPETALFLPILKFEDPTPQLFYPIVQ